MATIHKQIVVNAPPEHVWAAIRDIGAVHSRLAQQFVVQTRLEGDSRLITFANGAVVRERIVDIDDHRRRLAYSVTEWQTTHHNASFQVFPEGEGRSRIQWIADLLPNSLADLVDGFMEQGSVAIRRTLEAAAARRLASAAS
jgi:carbon monoxide dehydrogenase subunit G